MFTHGVRGFVTPPCSAQRCCCPFQAGAAVHTRGNDVGSRQEVLAQINQIRAQHGLSVLEPDPRLQRAAAHHSTRWRSRAVSSMTTATVVMVRTHSGPLPAGLAHRREHRCRAGWCRCGGRGLMRTNDVHRANILRPEWRGTGISWSACRAAPIVLLDPDLRDAAGAVPMPMPERMSRSSAR